VTRIVKTLGNASDRDEVVERLGRLQSDSARRWGTMSPHEAVCHLSDSFKLCLGTKEAALTSPNAFNRVVVKWIALQAPMQWPRGVKTRPEVDQKVGGTRPTEFARDVDELRAIVLGFAPGYPGFGSKPHPIFGMMSEAEWLRWGYLHMDHHLRQFGV
jgi:hypothetical protein